MLEIKLLYVAGWALMVWVMADEAADKSWVWCVGAAVGCMLWPSALIIGVLANKLAEQEVRNRRK